MPSTSFMGATVRRREDPRLITGSATYVDDIALTNMAHMAVLRSPHPHARIVGINVAEALAQPGVLAAATGEDVKHLIPPQQGEQQGEAGPSARPPLAVGVVRYIGDPVVAIVATDVALAFDALEYVDIEYEQLAGIGDVEKALLPGAPQIDEASPGNVAERREHKAGDADKAFADADLIASVRMVSQRLSPNPMEPRGVVAQYEGGSGEVTVYSSTQCAHFVRDALCEAFQVPQTKMRVIAPEVGGGFGCKGGAYGEDVLAVHFARALQRPIKWIETRSEHIQSTVHGRAQVAYVDLAAKNDGQIIGLRLRLILDSGAYPAPWLAMITAGMVTGCYHIPNLSSESITVLTNKTPLGAYRGAGRPEAAFYIERAMDVLAGKLGIDPAEIRRRNFVPPDAFPYQLPDWPAFDSGQYAATLDFALEQSHYEEFRHTQEKLRDEGRMIGIGLASYVEVCGFGWETASVRVEADATVTIYSGISPHGQGQETTFSQIAADVLGVDPEQVNLIFGDTSMGSGFGTMGSRGTAVGGPAVHRAASTVREKMREIAAHLLEAHPEDLDLEDSAWRVKGVPDRFVPLVQIAATAYGGENLPAGMDPGLTAINNFNPGKFTAPFGTHVVHVEIDRETGQIEIQKYLSVDDCGTILSPLLVQGQVHGGLAQGIAQALFEEMVYGDDGQLLTGSLIDYAIPSAADLPSYETAHTTTTSPHNELGVKGIGEAATIGSTPAVVNAVMDALAPLGITHLDMPLTPDKIWRTINDAGQRSPRLGVDSAATS